MQRHPRWWCGQGALLAFVLLAGASASRAADPETRHFQIFVDNRPAGSYFMTIDNRDDGTTVVSARADVRIRYLLVSYHYAYRGTEVWKQGKLATLTSSSDDDGKRFSVAAQTDGESLRVNVNGAESRMPDDVWTTSCWRLPDAKHRNGAITVLDVDTGRQIAGNMSYVGTGQLNIAGQVEQCVHYRVTGGIQLELWYDAQDRLVRQESIDDGHHTRLELRSR